DILHLMHGQSELQQREFMKIRGLLRFRCPTVFTLTEPARKIPGVKSYKLRLYCEEPGAWHQLAGDDGCYTVKELDPWLDAALPHLRRITRILATATPIVGAVLGMTAWDLSGRLKEDVRSMADLLGLVQFAEGTEVELSGSRDWGMA